MMNHYKAIKLLDRVENPQIVQRFAGNTDRFELELMSRWMFKFADSMPSRCSVTPSSTRRCTLPSSCSAHTPISNLDE